MKGAKNKGTFNISSFRVALGDQGLLTGVEAAGALDGNPYPASLHLSWSNRGMRWPGEGGLGGFCKNMPPSGCQPSAAVPSFQETSAWDPRGL